MRSTAPFCKFVLYKWYFLINCVWSISNSTTHRTYLSTIQKKSILNLLKRQNGNPHCVYNILVAGLCNIKYHEFNEYIDWSNVINFEFLDCILHKYHRVIWIPNMWLYCWFLTDLGNAIIRLCYFVRNSERNNSTMDSMNRVSMESHTFYYILRLWFRIKHRLFKTCIHRIIFIWWRY